MQFSGESDARLNPATKFSLSSESKSFYNITFIILNDLFYYYSLPHQNHKRFFGLYSNGTGPLNCGGEI